MPSDHFTRYDGALLREQFARFAELESWIGISLFWGVRPWSRLLGWLGPSRARLALRIADRIARLLPGLADVIVVAGRPNRPV